MRVAPTSISEAWWHGSWSPWRRTWRPSGAEQVGAGAAAEVQHDGASTHPRAQLSLEHAPEHRRAFYTSFTLGGTQTGLIIATAAWLPIGALPEHDLLTWGWRIPFWLSALVVVVGLLIRRRLDDAPAFGQTVEDGVERVPLAVLLRDHRANVLRVTFGALASTVSTIFACGRCRSPSTPSASTRRPCCGSPS